MIKRVINTNISLQDAFTNMIEASVANILTQKGIENGDASPVTDLGDVKKKGNGGKIVDVKNTVALIKNSNGEIVEVNCTNGIYSAILTEGDEISYDFNENGEAYLYTSLQNPESTYLEAESVYIKSVERAGTDVSLNSVSLVVQSEDELFTTLKLKKDKIFLDTGKFEDKGGLIIIEDLTKKLNNCLDAIKKLELAYNAHTHIVSGTATAIPAPSTNMTKLPKFNRDDYENKNIKHSL